MGAWIETQIACKRGEIKKVAPFMGAWIETLLAHPTQYPLKLLPLWEHGLKQYFDKLLMEVLLVAPFMGAWIETFYALMIIKA